jgi:hypothetical protein
LAGVLLGRWVRTSDCTILMPVGLVPNTV